MTFASIALGSTSRQGTSRRCQSTLLGHLRSEACMSAIPYTNLLMKGVHHHRSRLHDMMGETNHTRIATTVDVSKFVFENIYCKFDTPLGIISDRELQFQASIMIDLIDRLMIKHAHSTPYYPQCNG